MTCALALVAPAYAMDHGPAFGYATAVNSQGLGTQLTASSVIGYGITSHITLAATLSIMFGSGSLPETCMGKGVEWDSPVSWRFLQSITGVGRRESPLLSSKPTTISVPSPSSRDHRLPLRLPAHH
jgi:hypothetical protein